MKTVCPLIQSPQLETFSLAGDYFELLKPRVMSLVVFTAMVGMYLAPGKLHPFLMFTSILCIAVGAGASGAMNMWYERDIDALMTRTKRRPLPLGLIRPSNALGFGIVLACGSTLMMAFAANYLSAFLLAFSIFFYVIIYTICLKRRTPQNIVIGGAAGAFPPIIGWVAVTNSISFESFVLFMIIFLWTPPHFWALALYQSADYAKAGIPMMPNVAGPLKTKSLILIYSILLAGMGLVPYFIKMSGLLYIIVSVLLGAQFIWLAFELKRSKALSKSKSFFKFSILYLSLIFFAFCADHFINGF